MTRIIKEAIMPVTKEQVEPLHNEGFSPAEIAEKLTTDEEKVTHQAVSKVIKSLEPKQEVVKTTGIQTFTAEEYGDYSVAGGRSRYGGEKGVKVNATIEELRAYINSGWRPSMLLEKWQMSEEELKQLTWALSRAELRDRQPTINYKQDFFRF